MELSKAWNRFKRGLKKEVEFDGCMSMTAKQIAKRTATIGLAVNYGDYSELIHRAESYIAKGEGLSWWNGWLEMAKSQKKEFGTSMVRALAIFNKVMNSKAWATFKEECEFNVSMIVDETKDMIYARILW